MEKRSRLLCIKQYLEEQTDEQHPVTVSHMLAYLESIGIPSSRRTVLSDIEQLTDAGIDVVCNTGRRYEYFIGDRHFELPELKMLVDAVQAAKFISVKKSSVLAEKLTALTSVHLADELQRQTYIEDHIKPNNERVYITVDMLHTAIHTGKKVKFKYYEYTREKKKVYKHNRKVYEFSPYGMIWNHDSYYVVGYSDSHGKAITFRVDRIATPELTDQPILPQPPDFDLSVYARSVFSMYDGPMRDVSLKCENTLMKTIIDRFGEDVLTEILDDEHFIASVHVSTSPTFFGWVFSFAGKMVITSPQQTVDEYRSLVQKQLES